MKFKIRGKNVEVTNAIKNYVKDKIGKLDKYLPRNSKKDVVAKIVVTEIGKNKGEKYEVSVAMDIPGGKVIAAKDECSNVFAGVDLVEAKLTGQIRRYKLEMQPHRQKKNWRKIFIRRK